ncbi:MAG TPA: DUF5700 domain-containing putative Zn-dependent protease [Candidatus Rubrimentiphilum sp.]|nr:DUF5700 domain-containing putative Zn-dependent protease [Candidatus Rubrimentiphilum sp.]
MIARVLAALLIAAALLPVPAVVRAADAPVSVTIDAAEAQTTLTILGKLHAGSAVASSDWNALFATRGYQRLKEREAAFKRPFTDDDFKAFVSGAPLIAQYQSLRDTLNRWMSADITQIAQRSFAYLPAGATIHATVYPLIKPKTNSFVYQLDTDPAIMLYLDPSVTKDQFANTVSHELLHTGDAQNCPPPAIAAQEKTLDPRRKAVLMWLSAFGEGWAVLAAAGGPGVHPHWEDPPADRAVWDKAMSGYDGDFQTLQQFFSDVAGGKLTGDAIATKAYTFFGAVQGPWYTVGYKMDVTIEREFGRPKLIEVLCDKREYLATYNAAASASNQRGNTALPLWPAALANLFN